MSKQRAESWEIVEVSCRPTTPSEEERREQRRGSVNTCAKAGGQWFEEDMRVWLGKDGFRSPDDSAPAGEGGWVGPEKTGGEGEAGCR